MKNENLFLDIEIPFPLGRDVLHQYFEKYKSGDQSAREIIIKHNMKIVFNEVLKRFQNTPYALEDLVSIGLVGLIKSVDTFDLSKKVQFSTYATRCIDNEILMFIRKDKKHLNKYSLNDTLRIDREGKELKIDEILYDDNLDLESICSNKEIFDIIYGIIRNLSEKDRKIVELRFGLVDGIPMKQIEIIRMLNVPRSSVYKLLKEVFLKIREEMMIRGYLDYNTEDNLENTKTAKIDENLDEELEIDPGKDKKVNIQKQYKI